MTSVEERIQCRWCHAQSPTSSRTCERCGAPLDVRDTVTDSGWREAPRLRDLTEIHWASSTCQLDAMLWKDETVPMSVMSTPGGAKRLLSGLPFVLSVARGPGRVALSRDATGELIVLPIDQPAEVDVREHALVVASGTLTYSFEKLPGVRAMLAAGTGMYLDRYVAQSGPGLLVLHGYGNVFERTLSPGETILLGPGAFLYKDSSVTMEVVPVDFKADFAGSVAPAANGGDGAQQAAAPETQQLQSQQAQPQQAQPQQQGGGMFGRGLRGLKAAKSMLNVGALTSAAENLRSGGGLQGLAAGLAGGGGSTFLRMNGPGRVGVQSMFKFHKSE
jgi:uncharacterized protein (AIM24 family)